MEKENKTILIHCVVRYGQIIGCYAKMEDAVQIVNQSIAKGQLCDLVVKLLI